MQINDLQINQIKAFDKPEGIYMPLNKPNQMYHLMKGKP